MQFFQFTWKGLDFKLTECNVSYVTAKKLLLNSTKDFLKIAHWEFVWFQGVKLPSNSAECPIQSKNTLASFGVQHWIIRILKIVIYMQIQFSHLPQIHAVFQIKFDNWEGDKLIIAFDQAVNQMPNGQKWRYPIGFAAGWVRQNRLISRWC